MTSSVISHSTLDATELATLTRAVESIESWAPGSHRFGHYAEMTRHGAAICRTENVSACRPDVAELVDGPIAARAAARLGVPVQAFKDKVNFKRPGGAGFFPHQDQTAYPGAPAVVSVLVAIDECSEESGCLWIADGIDHELPTDDRGVILDRVANDLRWQMVELGAGDAILIDGFAPHFSDANRTDSSRRVLVASFAAHSSGYSRREYYDARAEAMRASRDRDGRFRISTHADFAGEEVAPEVCADDACTHA